MGLGRRGISAEYSPNIRTALANITSPLLNRMPASATEVAVQDDGEHAGQRDDDAGELRPAAAARQTAPATTTSTNAVREDWISSAFRRLGVLQRPVRQRVV